MEQTRIPVPFDLMFLRFVQCSIVLLVRVCGFLDFGFIFSVLFLFCFLVFALESLILN